MGARDDSLEIGVDDEVKVGTIADTRILITERSLQNLSTRMIEPV